jgi:hypothetical protein
MAYIFVDILVMGFVRWDVEVAYVLGKVLGFSMKRDPSPSVIIHSDLNFLLQISHTPCHRKCAKLFWLCPYGIVHLVFLSHLRGPIPLHRQLNYITWYHLSQTWQILRTYWISIHAHRSQSVVDCFSLMTHILLVSSNLESETFKHPTWPIVSVNLNFTMLNFMLFHNITCYTTSLSTHVHVSNTTLRNITCTVVATRCDTMEFIV